MYLLAKQTLEILDRNFVGIFLYGSQNYGLDNEHSDTDAILIVKQAERARKELHTQKGIVKIYTLKYFLSRLKQGDLECYEILYTPHCFINPEYKTIFDTFVQNFTQVINTDRIKHALLIKLREHLIGVTWLFFDTEGSKYHRKRVYWIYRVLEQYEQIELGKTFKDTLIYPSDKREELLKIKSITNYLPLKELDKKMRYVKQLLSSKKKFDIEVTESEEEILSNFYSNITYMDNDLA